MEREGGTIWDVLLIYVHPYVAVTQKDGMYFALGHLSTFLLLLFIA